MLNSFNSSGLSQQTLPRVDLADRNVESSSNIFYCFIALRNDADTLSNGFGCDRMVSSNHDNLKYKQTDWHESLACTAEQHCQNAGFPYAEKNHMSFVLILSPNTEANNLLLVCKGLRWKINY